MNKKNSDRGLLNGILGGIIVSIFNLNFQYNKESFEEEDYDIDRFNSFSYEENRKQKGYKLKYDIDESKIRPKFVSLIQVDEYSYMIKVGNKQIKDAIHTSSPETSWKMLEIHIESILKENMYNGIVIIDNIVPKYWIYGKEESDDFIKIIITDNEIPKYCIQEIKTINDNYTCLEINEARELAKEMKKFYHNHVEKVIIIEKLDRLAIVNTKNYKNMALSVVPNYYDLLGMVGKINKLKYTEISKQLIDIRFQRKFHILYTLFSLGMQLYYDGYNEHAIKVLESLIKVDKVLLNESGLESEIYQNVLYLYIELEDEKQIIDLIRYRYKYEYNFISKVADKLYDLEFYDSANCAYNILIKDGYKIADDKYFPLYNSDLFKAYIRTQNDEGMKEWREILIREGKDTWQIDRYLNDKDIEGLEIKIAYFEKEENWNQVINYCNKYKKLIIDHPWGSIDKSIDYEFKKIKAYVKLNNYNGAWNASCKLRSTLMSNFNGVDYFKSLSNLEHYMSDICLKQNYLIDTIYHHVLHIIYRYMFEYYSISGKGNLNWSINLSLEEIIEISGLKEIWAEIETMIKFEYNKISEKTIRNINSHIIDILEKNNYKLILDGSKKYFPAIIARDFIIE